MRLIVLLFFLAVTGQAHGLGNAVLFSPTEGRLVLNNEPVAGVKIERTVFWTWAGETITDYATTDANGYFRFKKLARVMIGGALLPHEPVVRQKLLVSRDGKPYEIWSHSKRDYELGTEYYDRPMRLICRLELEPSEKRDRWRTYNGVCDPE